MGNKYFYFSYYFFFLNLDRLKIIFLKNNKWYYAFVLKTLSYAIHAAPSALSLRKYTLGSSFYVSYPKHQEAIEYYQTNTHTKKKNHVTTEKKKKKKKKIMGRPKKKKKKKKKT